MIELRYNKDGKLEYRTSRTIPNKPSRESVDKLRSIFGPNADISVSIYPDLTMDWNEWIVVPSEEQSSVEKSELDQIHESCDRVSREEGILTLSEEITSLNKEINRLTRERDTATIDTIDAEIWKSLYYSADAGRAMKQMTLEKSEARVAQLEAEKQTLLESEMWGVNCKPSASNADPVAWGVKKANGDLLYTTPNNAVASGWRMWPDHAVVPLYTEPQPVKEWLTKEERKWIEYMESNCVLPYAGMKCMEAILARSSPPEVVLPPCVGWADTVSRSQVKEALAAAGVKVKETKDVN